MRISDWSSVVCSSDLYRRCHREDRIGLARLPLGRAHAVELDSAKRARQHGGMTDQIARIRITLEDLKPAIWRRVEMPGDASFKMLHDVIQGAMGWLDYHLWGFEAAERHYGVVDPAWDGDPLLAAK